MAVYLIKHTDLTPDTLRAGTPNECWTVEPEPGRTNMSHEPRAEGWLGQTGDTSSTAFGEFPDLAAAKVEAKRWLGEGQRLSDGPFGSHGEPDRTTTEIDEEAGTLARWYVVPTAYTEIWQASDWIQRVDAREYLASHSNDIDECVKTLTAEALEDSIRVDGLEEWLRQVQQDAKDADDE